MVGFGWLICCLCWSLRKLRISLIDDTKLLLFSGSTKFSALLGLNFLKKGTIFDKWHLITDKWRLITDKWRLMITRNRECSDSGGAWGIHYHLRPLSLCNPHGDSAADATQDHIATNDNCDICFFILRQHNTMIYLLYYIYYNIYNIIFIYNYYCFYPVLPSYEVHFIKYVILKCPFVAIVACRNCRKADFWG